MSQRAPPAPPSHKMAAMAVLVRTREGYSLYVENNALRTHGPRVPTPAASDVHARPAETLARTQLCLTSSLLNVRPYYASAAELLLGLLGRAPEPPSAQGRASSLLEILVKGNVGPREGMLALITYLHYQHHRLLLADPDLETLDGICASAKLVDASYEGITSLGAAIYMRNAALSADKRTSAEALTYGPTPPQNYTLHARSPKGHQAPDYRHTRRPAAPLPEPVGATHAYISGPQERSEETPSPEESSPLAGESPTAESPTAYARDTYPLATGPDAGPARRPRGALLAIPTGALVVHKKGWSWNPYGMDLLGE